MENCVVMSKLLCNVCSGDPQKSMCSGKRKLSFDVVSDLVVASSLSSDQNAIRAAMEVDPVKTGSEMQTV